MIEVISTTRCTGCNICVTACPTNVFDAVKGGIPVIARQEDCQTCFMCEVWCPDDALFVDPDADAVTGVAEKDLEQLHLFGSYRRAVGWADGGRIAPPPEVMARLRS